MKITTVGIDLAKSVFQVHGVDQRGKPVVQKRLRRQQVLRYFAQLPPCLVGMEACGGAHYWPRGLDLYLVNTQAGGKCYCKGLANAATHTLEH